MVYSYLEKIYLFKVDNGNTRKRFETCSKLTFKETPGEHNDVPVVFLLLNLNIFQKFL